MNDVRKIIYTTISLFLGVVVLWLSLIYISSCGFTLTCRQAAPKIYGTPIPTLIPAAHKEAQVSADVTEFTKCQIGAADLVGAWVSAKAPETEAFTFSDLNGKACQGTFAADIQPLLVENSVWYANSIGCVSCHNADLTDRSGGLDLTSYAAIQMGSGRADANTKGADILGGGNWESSKLYGVLVKQGLVATGHAADSQTAAVVLFAGQIAPEATATPTP